MDPIIPIPTYDHSFVAQNTFVAKVFGWMTLALVISGAFAAAVAGSPLLTQIVFGNVLVFYGLIIAELVLVAWLSIRVERMSTTTAQVLFVIYSALNGVTLAAIFLVFTNSSIAITFLIAAATFGLMSIYGYTTKRDLTAFSSLFRMTLFGLILASIVNIFWLNYTLYWIVTYVGVFLFVGLVAYDAQRIKDMSVNVDPDSPMEKKGAIMGALALYLDFINLFLFLLRIFGRRR